MQKIVLLTLLLFVLFSCKDEEEFGNMDERMGGLSVEFLTDRSVQTRAVVNKYSLDICKTDGTVVASYPDCSALTERILLPVGDYKLIAKNGKDTVAGFETPFYRAEQNVKIESATTKEVSMVCRQANVKVSASYSQAIQQSFKQYALTVTNGLGELVFGKDETRSGFFSVNDGTLKWDLALDNGQEVYHLNKTITNVKAREHYMFSFNIKENGSEDDGAFVPSIKVDTTTRIFEWEFEVVLKDTLARPAITRVDGGIWADPFVVLEQKRGANVQAEITSGAQIQELRLTHHSTVLEGMGIPRMIDLANITDELKGTVNAAGILWGNEPVLDAKKVTVDFSGLANKLPLGNYEFAVQVYDAASRMANEVLKVNVIPDVDHAAQNIVRHEVWAKFATITGMWYTAERPAGMGLEYSDNQSEWIKVQQVSFDDVQKTVAARISGLIPGKQYYYRTYSDDFVSDDIKTFTTESATQVPYLNFDTWFKLKKSWYLGEENNKIWDSGNDGANTVSEMNPTAPDANTKVNIPGNMNSALLETKVVFGVMAAGNIYTGNFIKAVVNLSNPGAELDFGIPYTARPTTLTGYYKYQPVAITQSSVPQVQKGEMDSCYIYVALFSDWTQPFRVNTQTKTFVDLDKAIALGELKTNKTMNDFEKFTINIDYRDKTKIPTYILIVATASKYGDYFTGGQGSKLWVDEFELGFDPVD